MSCRTDFRVRLSFFVDPTCLQSLCLQSFCFHFHTTPSTVNLVCWCNERLASARGAGTGALSLPALFTVKLLSLSAFVSGARADQRAGISELAVMDSRVEVIKTALCLRCLLFFLLSPFRLGGSASAGVAACTLRGPQMGGEWRGEGRGHLQLGRSPETNIWFYSHCTFSPPPLAISRSHRLGRTVTLVP